jgi:PhzF family phenazine biosynthesis protein
MPRPFELVDVFGAEALVGNPLAVIHYAGGLTAEEMLRITRWLNFSETTFLTDPTSPEADYAVRIFTPAHELPFAGHPTLGSCHAWLRAGGVPRSAGQVIQECGAGLITIRRDSKRLAFAAPPLIRSGPAARADLEEVASVLGVGPDEIVEARWIDNGPGWIGVLLESADAVLALAPAKQHSRRIDIGVVGPHAPGGPCAFELRALFTDQHGGLREDPVTGSLNASVAQWLFEIGRARGAYVAAQGTKIGCSGRIYLEEDAAGQIWVGGDTRTLFSGSSAD